MRLSLCNQLESRNGTLTKDAMMKNMVSEVIEGVPTAVKRPGITNAEAGVTGGVAQGVIGLSGVVYSIVSDNIYQTSGSSLVGGFSLATGLPLKMYDDEEEYDIDDEIYYQDPVTGKIGKYSATSNVSQFSPPAASGYKGELWRPASSPTGHLYQIQSSSVFANSQTACKAAWFAYISSQAGTTFSWVEDPCNLVGFTGTLVYTLPDYRGSPPYPRTGPYYQYNWIPGVSVIQIS